MGIVETLKNEELPMAPIEQPCARKCSYYEGDEQREISKDDCRIAKNRAVKMGISDVTCGYVARQAIEMVEIYNQLQVTAEGEV